MQSTVIDLGNIDAASAAPGRWYWRTGQLSLCSEGDLADPSTNKIGFVLVGIKVRWSYDLTFSQEQGMAIEFTDPMELAMRLCEQELTNADAVVKQVKEAIKKLGE